MLGALWRAFFFVSLRAFKAASPPKNGAGQNFWLESKFCTFSKYLVVLFPKLLVGKDFLFIFAKT